MPLDFARPRSSSWERRRSWPAALGITVADLRALRTTPLATSEQLRRLGEVLTERGKGMLRVGEMLLEDHRD
jgi:hypothetical protein